MESVFVDSNYYIAVLLDRDRLHMAAIETNSRLANASLVTSEAVLFEVLNHLSKLGSHARDRSVQLWHRLHADDAIEVVGFDGGLADRAVELYAARADKRYSLTDCLSMVICADRGITNVLTHDHNFEQEGLIVLIKEPR